MHPKSTPYLILCTLSFAACSASMHMLNKVTVALTGAPSTLTTVQMAIAVILTMVLNGQEVLTADRKKLMYWCVVPLMYAGMLNSSLMGYQYLSLSLVTVFRNLAPLVTIAVENTVMDVEHRQKITMPIVGALLMMIAGAVVFNHGQAESTWIGLGMITVNTLMAIGDRLLQRRLLVSECQDLPLSACMTLNNSLGMLPTFAMAYALHEVDGYSSHVFAWTDPATLVLVVLSGVMGLGIGTFGLMCQRAMTATSFQVVQNASKVTVVVIGVYIFGDNLHGATRGFGMALSLLGSLAYGIAKAMDAAPAAPSAAVPEKGERQTLLGGKSPFAAAVGPFAKNLVSLGLNVDTKLPK